MSEAEGPFFLDSNILIYAFDTREPVKRAHSRALIESLPAEHIVLSARRSMSSTSRSLASCAVP